jgi:hypothetical protein
MGEDDGGTLRHELLGMSSVEDGTVSQELLTVK